MATVTVSISESAKRWIDEQVEAGEFSNTEDYLRELIDRDRELRDEERLEALRRLVRVAHASGLGTKTIDQIMAEAVAEAKRRGTYRE